MGSIYNEADGIWRSHRPSLDLPADPHMGLVEFFQRNTSDPRLANKLALVDAVTKNKLTYQQLKHRISVVAANLSDLGIRKADVVLILCPNSIHLVEVFFAVISLGAVVTTVNPLNTAQEIGKQAEDSSPSLVFTVPELLPKVRRLGLPIVLLGDSQNSNGFIAYADMLVAKSSHYGRAAAAPSQNETAALLYSSGTTGVSKGVMLSHRNFISVAEQVNVDALLEGRGDEVVLCMLPMFHIFGLAVVTYSSLQRGNTVVVMPKFDFVQLLKSIHEFRVNQLPVVPPIVIALAKQPVVGDYDLSSLKNIICGAAPLGKEIMEECSRRFPSVDLRQGYGLTESTGMSLLSNPKEDPDHRGSAGTLVAGTEAMVVDVETGKPLPANKEGELWLRGPHIMKGYLNNPAATAATLDKDGWLHTGDLVYMNEAGRLYVMDRMKELIKYKGFQVAPAELEALLLSHPMILDAAVVPLPDDEAGQVPIAYVVREPNSSVEEADVLKFVAEQVAPYKKLRRAIFIEAIPKSPAGKILRRELTQRKPSKL